MDRPTQIHLRYYSYVGYCIDTNIFFSILIGLPPKLLYYLTNNSRILNMSLDLKLVDGELVSINHLQIDGRTDKKMDRHTPAIMI